MAHVIGWITATVVGSVAEGKLSEQLNAADSCSGVEPFGLGKASGPRLARHLGVWHGHRDLPANVHSGSAT